MAAIGTPGYRWRSPIDRRDACVAPMVELAFVYRGIFGEEFSPRKRLDGGRLASVAAIRALGRAASAFASPDVDHSYEAVAHG